MKWLQRLLGIKLLLLRQQQIHERVAKIDNRLGDIEHNTRVSHDGLGRVLAKLDSLYGIPEDDPRRKAASDALGNDIIRKLKDEDAARRAMEHR